MGYKCKAAAFVYTGSCLVTMSQSRSQGSTPRNREISTRARRGSVEKADKRRETSSPGISAGQAGIRTRLSTGSIHLNGTTTVTVPKQPEENESVQMNKRPPPGLRNLKRDSIPGTGPPPKKRKIGRNDGTGEDNCNDYFCWLCHREGIVICCELCPRVYHAKCLGLDSDLPSEWVCPECEKIMRAECLDTRSKAMSMITLDTLGTLLKSALQRMHHPESEPFTKPVDLSSVQSYTDYIFNPMDLTELEKNIKKKVYGCTEAFLADTKWILHNCTIFNGTHHKLTSAAKSIVKICRHEMNEIELCPDCYMNSCTKKDNEWFCEPCRVPHTLVWAKLKGYPFWPSKVLREQDGQVDVRFFGAHDRSWVSLSQLFLLSHESPTPSVKGRKGGMDDAMREVKLHIQRLGEKFGTYRYAPFRTPYDKNHVNIRMKEFSGSPPKSPMGKSLKKRLKIAPDFRVGRGKMQADAKTDNLSHVSKTASAVKSKYSSLVSSRKGVTTNYKITPAGVFMVTEKSTSNSPRELPLKNSSVTMPKVFKTDQEIILKIENKLKSSEQEEDVDVVTESENDQVDDSPAEIVLENVERSHNNVDNKCENGKDDKELKKDPSSTETGENIRTDSKRSELKTKESVISKESKIENKEDNSDSSGESGSEGSPSKQEYLDNLKKTIESCKAKLGIDETENVDSTDDSSGDEDSEETAVKAIAEKHKGEEGTEKSGENIHEIKTPETNREVKKLNLANLESESKETSSEIKKLLSEKIAKQKVENSISDKKAVEERTVSDSTEIKEKQVARTTENSVSENKISASDEAKVENASKSNSQSEPEKSPDKTLCSAKAESDSEETGGLLMEVESEPDSDRLTIDTDQDECSVRTPTRDKIICATSRKSDVTEEKVSRDKPSDEKEEREESTENKLVSDSEKGTVSATSSKILLPTKSDAGTTENLPGRITPPGRSRPVSTSSVTTVTSGALPVTDSAKSVTENVHSNTIIKRHTKKLLESLESSIGTMCAELMSANVTKSQVETHSNPPSENRKAELDHLVKEHVQESHKADIDRLMWDHVQELAELKHNFELSVSEIKSCFEVEKQRCIKDMKAKCILEKQEAVAEAKKKQWCANCGKEAIFYCCWNTSYCDYPCQQSHWNEHMPYCQQTSPTDKPADSSTPQNTATLSNTPVSDGTNSICINLVPVSSTSSENSGVVTNNIEGDSYTRQVREELTAVLNKQVEEKQKDRRQAAFFGSYPPNTHGLTSKINTPQFDQNQTSPHSSQSRGTPGPYPSQGGAPNRRVQHGQQAPNAYQVQNGFVQILPGTNTMSSQMQHTQNPAVRGIISNPSGVQVQYVQPSQPVMVSGGPRYQTTPQVQMQGLQARTGMLQSNPLLQQTQAVVYGPLQVRPPPQQMGAGQRTIMPGNPIVISQNHPRGPRQNIMPNAMPFQNRQF